MKAIKKITPKMVTIVPDFAICFEVISPLEKAIAFGGVLIGSVMASDAATPTATTFRPTDVFGIAITIGISIAAAAVLDMKLLNKITATINILTSTIGLVFSMGNKLKKYSPKPVALIAVESDKAPPTSNNTGQSIFDKSLLVIIPVAVNINTGTMAATAAGIPVKLEVIHKTTVSKNEPAIT